MGVDAGRGNPRAQTIDSQNAEHEEHPLTQVGNPENIKKLLKHDWLSASFRAFADPRISAIDHLNGAGSCVSCLVPAQAPTGFYLDALETSFPLAFTGASPPKTTALPPAFSIFSDG